MSFKDDFRRFVSARLKERQRRQTILFLSSLPAEIRKDIGWFGPEDRPE